MTALDLVTGLSQAIFVLIFALVALRLVRTPTPAHADMTLFFGILTFVVVESRLAALVGVVAPEWFTDTLIAIIVALPYVMVRLVDDFTTVPRLLKRAAEAALVAFAVTLYAIPGPTLPPPLILAREMSGSIAAGGRARVEAILFAHPGAESEPQSP